MHRRLNRLALGEAPRLPVDQAFLAPNEVAVAVAIMSRFGSDRTPPLKILAVSCDHTSYLDDAEGLEVLARAIRTRRQRTRESDRVEVTWFAAVNRL